jgi:hypothetical protein
MQWGIVIISGGVLAAGYLFLPLLQRYLLQNHGNDDLEIPMEPSADYALEMNDDGTVAPRIWHLIKNGSIPRPGAMIGFRRRYDMWKQEPSNLNATARLFDFLERANAVRDFNEAPLGVSVAKDRIFGLLGMVGDSSELGFDVDYRASDEEVFTNVARVLLLAGEMGVLSFARLHSSVKMPSWAPDWRDNLVDPCAEKGFFKPAGNRATPAPLDKGGDILSFEGITVDTISHVGVSWEPETHGGQFKWTDALRVLKEVYMLVTSKETAPELPLAMTMERWREGIWRIPIADQYTNDIGLRIRAPPVASEGWHLLTKGPSVLKGAASNGMTDLNYYQMAMERLHGRRLVQTGKGFVGLAPVNVQLGDLICILSGMGSPLLLRPGTSSTVYQIVGEAYVYSIMDGEMVTPGTVFENFDIC